MEAELSQQIFILYLSFPDALTGQAETTGHTETDKQDLGWPCDIVAKGAFEVKLKLSG